MECDMSGFTQCPNCAKEGLTVPLSVDAMKLACALCGSTFDVNSQLN